MSLSCPAARRPCTPAKRAPPGHAAAWEAPGTPGREPNSQTPPDPRRSPQKRRTLRQWPPWQAAQGPWGYLEKQCSVKPRWVVPGCSRVQAPPQLTRAPQAGAGGGQLHSLLLPSTLQTPPPPPRGARQPAPPAHAVAEPLSPREWHAAWQTRPASRGSHMRQHFFLCVYKYRYQWSLPAASAAASQTGPHCCHYWQWQCRGAGRERPKRLNRESDSKRIPTGPKT